MKYILAVIFALVATQAFAAIDVIVDKSRQQMTVIVNDQTRYVWPVSTGDKRHDTPSGTYKAFRMEEDHFSVEFDSAPMPHSIFFTQKGHALHGSYDIKHLGKPVSHGCVRLHPDNATRLYALVEKHGLVRTTVVITDKVNRNPFEDFFNGFNRSR